MIRPLLHLVLTATALVAIAWACYPQAAPWSRCEVPCLESAESAELLDCDAVTRNHMRAVHSLATATGGSAGEVCDALRGATVEFRAQPWRPMRDGFLTYGEFLAPSTVRVLLGSFPPGHRLAGQPLPAARYPHELGHVLLAATGRDVDREHARWGELSRAEALYAESEPEMVTGPALTGAFGETK